MSDFEGRGLASSYAAGRRHIDKLIKSARRADATPINMTVSWLIVTLNRRQEIGDCFLRNKSNAGCAADEIVWVDNGSTDGMADFARSQRPDKLILHGKNLGCSKAMNIGMAACSSEWIMTMVCQCDAPDNWLQILKQVAASGSVDSVTLNDINPSLSDDRTFGEDEIISGHRCRNSIPFGNPMFKRSLLSSAGYYREDLGLYGWSDVEWCRRMQSRKIKSVMLMDKWCERVAVNQDWLIEREGNMIPYWRFKELEVADQKKHRIIERSEAENYPYINPF